jgi:hypothetical protein
MNLTSAFREFAKHAWKLTEEFNNQDVTKDAGVRGVNFMAGRPVCVLV